MTAGKWWQLEIAKSYEPCTKCNLNDAAINHNGDEQVLKRIEYLYKRYNSGYTCFLNVETEISNRTARRGLITLKS